MAAHQKKTRDLHGTLVFTDESGFLLAPLTRRTLAPIGQTPLLLHRAKHRDKVSAAAALLLSPVSGRVRLFYQTFPDTYVDAELYSFFVRHLLRTAHGPLVLLHDQGNMHRGDPIRKLCEDFPRLHLHNLPTYAPELNPVESCGTGVRTSNCATSRRTASLSWTPPRVLAWKMPEMINNGCVPFLSPLHCHGGGHGLSDSQ